MLGITKHRYCIFKNTLQEPEAAEETFHLPTTPEISRLFLTFFECMVQASYTDDMTR